MTLDHIDSVVPDQCCVVSPISSKVNLIVSPVVVPIQEGVSVVVTTAFQKPIEMIKAPAGWPICLLTESKVPFPQHVCGVVRRSQLLCQGCDIRWHAKRSSR